jgi:predicted RNA-binding protein with PUA-like domain
LGVSNNLLRVALPFYASRTAWLPLATVVRGARLFSDGVPRMRYWLMKSEPDEVSFADVLAAPGRTVAWFGVRNYQARNFMRDQMQVGDGVLFYHSSCAVPGVAGIAKVASGPYPDASQFDPASPYHDPKATREQPRWISVDVMAVAEGRYLPLTEMRAVPELEDMVLLQKGSRLSISPVTAGQWTRILELAGVDAAVTR